MDGDDLDLVLGAGHLFDHEPTREATAAFLCREGHHLLLAFLDTSPVGFVSGIEVIHPDKGAEMLLYEPALATYLSAGADLTSAAQVVEWSFLAR